jgi:hypothetical protein
VNAPDSAVVLTAPTFFYRVEAWAVPLGLSQDSARLENQELNALLDRELPRWGRVVWRERRRNLVTDQGARWLITHGFVTAQTSIPWHVMFKGSGAFANADTMATHAAWTEVTAYSQPGRQALTLTAPITGRSANNSSSPASITANATTVVHGLALTSNSTKGNTAGTLYGGADFASSQSLASGQILRAVATVSL